MNKVADIQTRMENLIEFIADANEKVRGGQMVDLRNLDDEVASLCEETVALPPQFAARIQPIMADMIQHLEELGRALKDFQDSLDAQN